MITHHGWRVTARPAIRRFTAPTTVQDDFAVLSAALDCCRALRDAGRDGIVLHEVNREDDIEYLRQIDWRELIASAA